MDYDKFAEELGLPKNLGMYSWFDLPEDTFVSWFKWDDNKDEKRLYLSYAPPYPIPAYYDFTYSFHIKSSLRLNTPLNIDLDITDRVHCCNLKCFMGMKYYKCLTSPKSGIFVNLINLDRLKGIGQTMIKKGEILFYIDYANTHLKEVTSEDILDKLRKLRELARRGVGGEQKNAERMFYEMLNKYGIQESELS